MSSEPSASLQQSIRNLGATVRQDLLPILGRLPSYGRLIYALVTSSSLEKRDKAALYLAIGYQLSPIDLIPGFIPVIGQIDDLLILLWAIRRTLDSLPPERANSILEGVGLTREQLQLDTKVALHAFNQTVTTATRIAKRGLLMALRAGVTGATYLGYLAIYLVRSRTHPAEHR